LGSACKAGQGKFGFIFQYRVSAEVA
jgi:hypothetical protein